MNNKRPLQFTFIIAISIYLSGCSNETSYAYSLPGPYFVNETFFVKQGSGQCGPTAFYMIFKFYGDNLYAGEFRELPDCADKIPLQENLNVVTKKSGVSKWLNVTNSGITLTGLLDKIKNLGTEKCTSYYKTEGNTDNKKNGNAAEFLRINELFLKHQKPVIIHLERPKLFGLSILSGHYVILAGYDSAAGIVYYVDPNKNKKTAVVQNVMLSDFLSSKWYRSPDHSLITPIPDAYWDGTWIGFTHLRK